jgi:hypothetical protein
VASLKQTEKNKLYAKYFTIFRILKEKIQRKIPGEYPVKERKAVRSMSGSAIRLNKEQMRKLARYELNLHDFDIPKSDWKILQFEGDEYIVTAQDMLAAVQNMKRKNTGTKDFTDSWLNAIDKLCKPLGIPDDTYQREWPGLDTCEMDFRYGLHTLFQAARSVYSDFVCLDDYFSLDAILQDLQLYLENQNKPVLERQYSDHDKLNYIRYFQTESDLENAVSEKLELARMFVNDLCEIKVPLALYIKGYSCYGGNRLFDCDWKASMECLEALFEIEDDPSIANTLGYIYYYGRHRGGIPDYRKAFACFTFGASNGLIESIYKLGDMYRHGYACKESPDTAKSLYLRAYQLSEEAFLARRPSKFTDSALRMAIFYMQLETLSPLKAWKYALLAECGLKEETSKVNDYGNDTVAFNVQKALRQAKKLLPKDYLKNFHNERQPKIFETLCAKGRTCLLSISKDQKTLCARRIASRIYPDPEDILITIPQISFCSRTRKASYTLSDTAKIWMEDDRRSVRFDFCTYNRSGKRYEFFYRDRLCARVSSDYFRLYAPPKEKPVGKPVRIASVCFSKGGRTYDYLCDDASVRPGDTVIVKGHHGDTRVTVADVCEMDISELSLSPDRYKKIVRKD